MLDDQFHVYDTPLRDGAQQEGLNLTVADNKLVIARHLDRFERRDHRRRLARGDPEGHRVLPPGANRARLAARDARGALGSTRAQGGRPRGG